jgi:hypothetical protein
VGSLQVLHSTQASSSASKQRSSNPSKLGFFFSQRPPRKRGHAKKVHARHRLTSSMITRLSRDEKVARPLSQPSPSLCSNSKTNFDFVNVSPTSAPPSEIPLPDLNQHVTNLSRHYHRTTPSPALLPEKETYPEGLYPTPPRSSDPLSHIFASD